MRIKRFGKNEKELETQAQTVKIYSQDIGMEFGTMLVMKSGKRHMTEGVSEEPENFSKQISIAGTLSRG